MHTTSISLLRQLQEGSQPAAWDRFVSLYTPLLYYWAKRVGLPADESEDYVQEVLLLLLEKLKQFEHRGQGSFRGWLRTVSMNKCRERFRRQKSPDANGGDGNLTRATAI